MCPTRAKPIPSERPNIIKDYDGNSPTYFQRNIHISTSGPHIILPGIPVPSPRVSPVQPSRMDTRGPSSNLISSCSKNPFPKFALAAHFLQVRKDNAVTHQISGVYQEYRHLFKVPDRKIWELSFANELGKLAQCIRTVK